MLVRKLTDLPRTRVQMGLSKWFLADDSRQQKKKNNMEDMLKGRGEWEAGPKRSCQWLFHNKNACLEPAIAVPPTHWPEGWGRGKIATWKALDICMNFQKYNIFFSNPEIKGEMPIVLRLLQVHPDMWFWGEKGETERKLGISTPPVKWPDTSIFHSWLVAQSMSEHFLQGS